MNIEESSLYEDVKEILANGTSLVYSKLTASIRNTLTNETIPVMKVLQMDIIRDYELNFTDDVRIRVSLPGGTYVNSVYPFQESLEVIVTDELINTNKRRITTYRAVLYDKGDGNLNQSGMGTLDNHALNMSSIVEADFQLISHEIEEIRTLRFGTVFREMLTADIIKSVLNTETRRTNVDGSKLVIGVNMVEPDNLVPRTSVSIPQRTRVVDIPGMVQKEFGGVYSSGLGYYLQNKYWYVYPCYDTTRLAKAENIITIINVPENKFPNIEKTYRVSGKNIVILATGKIRLTDNSQSRQLNLGTGTRYANANRFMEGFAETKSNKTLASRGKVNSEYNAYSRDDGKTHAPVSNNAINSNPFYENSKLASRSGGVISLVWENSNPDLIKPDTMVRLLYIADNKVVEKTGIILKCHHFRALNGIGMTEDRYVTSSVLAIFIKS